MGNGVFTDQGNFPTHGIRDVRKAADRKQHDWSQLAKAPITKQPNSLLATANSYNPFLQSSIRRYFCGQQDVVT